VRAGVLTLAAALISITLNPVMFAGIDPVVSGVRSRSVRARALGRSPDPLAELPSTVDARTLTGHVQIVGYGRAGRRARCRGRPVFPKVGHGTRPRGVHHAAWDVPRICAWNAPGVRP
jgi:hypothetical protein